MQSEGGEVIAPGHREAPTTPADVANRCMNCNSDLSAENLDLKLVAERFGQKEIGRSWREGAEGGCMFCRLITAVEEDAKQRYSVEVWFWEVEIKLPPDGQYLLRLIKGFTALPHVPNPRARSMITIFSKGKAHSIDRYVLIYQHHRFQAPHPLRRIQASASASH
jgi:hypothetical protein